MICYHKQITDGKFKLKGIRSSSHTGQEARLELLPLQQRRWPDVRATLGGHSRDQGASGGGREWTHLSSLRKETGSQGGLTRFKTAGRGRQTPSPATGTPAQFA